MVDASAPLPPADSATALVQAVNALCVPNSELGGTIYVIDLITIGLPKGTLADVSLNALDLIGAAVQIYSYEYVVTTTQPINIDSALLSQLGIGGAEPLLQVVEPPHFDCGRFTPRPCVPK